MGALFGECVLNRESHYIRRWRLTNTSDTIVILSLTHETKFRLFETIFHRSNNVLYFIFVAHQNFLLGIKISLLYPFVQWHILK